MSNPAILQLLQQEWKHSYEEDLPGQKVYRPAAYAFPPSRGRTGFELLPNQVSRSIGIAPTDGPDEAHGNWQLEQDSDSDTLKLSSPQQPTKLMHIISAAPDKLVVKE